MPLLSVFLPNTTFVGVKYLKSNMAFSCARANRLDLKMLFRIVSRCFFYPIPAGSAWQANKVLGASRTRGRLGEPAAPAEPALSFPRRAPAAFPLPPPTAALLHYPRACFRMTEQAETASAAKTREIFHLFLSMTLFVMGAVLEWRHNAPSALFTMRRGGEYYEQSRTEQGRQEVH